MRHNASYLSPAFKRSKFACGRFGRNFTGANTGVRMVGAAADSPVQQQIRLGATDAEVDALVDPLIDQSDAQAATYVDRGDAATDANEAATDRALYARPVAPAPTTAPAVDLVQRVQASIAAKQAEYGTITAAVKVEAAKSQVAKAVAATNVAASNLAATKDAIAKGDQTKRVLLIAAAAVGVLLLLRR
jgi:hypothetical protein